MKQTNDKPCTHYDFLTKLHNRSSGLDVINQLIDDKQPFSLFYIDLDKFKIVNDVYGHEVGDFVLEEVGRRFQSLEKEGLIFARFGGDEFIGIYQTVDEQQINALGQSLIDVLADHIVISQSEFTISASVGVARYPENADNMDDLLKLADMAMYKAKRSEADHQYLISDELNEKLANRKKIEVLLRKMDVEKDLFIEYQPIFDAHTGALTGMESLVRWRYNQEVTIYPNDFIYVAEEIDFVKDITKWVFIESLKQVKIWNEKYQTNYKVSLNVADACVHNKIFFTNIEYMLETFGVKAEWLILELSENSLSVSPEFMKQLLNTISNRGIEISIDNFGTHPLVISTIKDFKVTEVKIAPQFNTQLEEEEHCVFNGLLMLAQGLGITAVAKGVETEEQHERLKAVGCPKAQGFYLGKPLPKIAFEEAYLKK